MLRQVARKAHQLPRQVERHAEAPVPRVEPDLADLFLGNILARPAMQLAGQRRHRIGGQAERLTNLAYGAARAVADHRGRKTRAVAAVFFVDVLDHLLAPFMLEIDIDVGRLVALGRHETFEQQVEARRIDGGDAEAVADRRIRRRSPPLAEDAAFARETDEVVDGQEIGRVTQLLDQTQLVFELRPYRVRRTAGIARLHPLPGQAFELALRRHAVGRDLVGILVAQFIQREMAAVRDFQGPGQRRLVILEQARHVRGRFQMAFRIGFEPPARLVDDAFLADTGQHVEQRPTRPAVHQHIVRRNQRGLQARRQIGPARQPPPVVAAAQIVRRQIDRARKRRPQIADLSVQPLRRIGQHHEDQPFAISQHVLAVQDAFPFRRAAATHRDQSRQAAIGRPIHRIGEQARPVRQVEPRSDEEPDPRLLRRDMRPDHTGETVAVGHGNRRMPQRRRLQHQFVRMRRPAQEAEIGRDLELYIHALAVLENRKTTFEVTGKRADVSEIVGVVVSESGFGPIPQNLPIRAAITLTQPAERQQIHKFVSRECLYRGEQIDPNG